MVCLGNMCMATLHKGDNDAIIIIIIIIINSVILEILLVAQHPKFINMFKRTL